ncbi:MAG: carboxypeptidase-like regulatory domain-containing protein [Candidatus Nanopelagicales bacterium]
MAPFKTAASAGLMLVLTACSQQGGSTSAVPLSGTASSVGTLTGLVRMYGGPMNPQTGKQALNGSPGPDWRVKVMSGAQTVAEATSDAAGRFRFSLAPGLYTLACGQEPSVTVVAGQTVSVDCDVPVP